MVGTKITLIQSTRHAFNHNESYVLVPVYTLDLGGGGAKGLTPRGRGVPYCTEVKKREIYIIIDSI
jgi:hypothetical protein